MKRFFTTLIILLVVIAAGLAALILLVNPNDFRDYIVNKVKEDTGYELVMKDDMRWHVWPKLSIITGKMSLTAPDAAEPVVTAENMRLDVELWPLLSHQLSVREVMLDGALLKILPETESKEKKSAPVAPVIRKPAWCLSNRKTNGRLMLTASVSPTACWSGRQKTVRRSTCAILTSLLSVILLNAM